MSTDRVLMMEYLEGGQVNDLEYIKKSGIDPFDVSNKLGVLYSKMIFLNGYVHSDPHPGNILVHKNKQGGTDIVLLDHGLYAVSCEVAKSVWCAGALCNFQLSHFSHLDFVRN